MLLGLSLGRNLSFVHRTNRARLAEISDRRRFAILDTDRHHGDGTRAVFEDNSNILQAVSAITITPLKTEQRSISTLMRGQEMRVFGKGTVRIFCQSP